MHLTVFTTAHPLDDVRVHSKFVGSFRSLGADIAWIGPAKSFFQGDAFRDPELSYSVYRSGSGRAARLLGMPRSAWRLLWHRGADWLYCPDPDAAAIAVLLRRFHRARIIFDVHEEYHGDHLDRWLGRRIGALGGQTLVWVLRAVSRRVDVLVGVNEPVIAPYARGARKTVIVKNSAPDWFADAPVPTDKNADRLRLFHGKATPANGTLPILEAASVLVKPVKVVMMPSSRTGNDVPYMADLPQRVADLGVADVLELTGSVPHTEIPTLMDTCHVGMIGYGRELGRASLPNRLFEYMARGLAVMAPSYSPLIAEILEEWDAGILRDFEDPESIADGIRWFQEHPEETAAMGARAREAFLTRYSWDSEFSRLVEAMD